VNISPFCVQKSSADWYFDCFLLLNSLEYACVFKSLGKKKKSTKINTTRKEKGKERNPNLKRALKINIVIMRYMCVFFSYFLNFLFLQNLLQNETFTKRISTYV
jgi:hypothetical protein